MSGTNNIQSQPKLGQSQHGMVSIMTTMILMIVISLIVLGFAQISRRNQRESLDRQLSTQAFYAAESGVNDARNLIKTAIATGQPVQDKTACGGTGTAGFYASLSPTIDSTHNVKYSCLLVDPAPKSLRYSDIGTPSTVIPLISSNGVALNKLKLDWQSKASSGSPTTGCPTGVVNIFTPAASWSCGYGVLRFDLVPTAGGSLTSNTLLDNTMTTFAVPFSSGGTASIPFSASGANTNNRVGVSCSSSGCSLTITGLTQNNYHLRVSSIYKDAAMQVSATDATNNQLKIAGSQAVIDVTGKAQDVLRRIQVNVPYRTTTKNELSDYAIEMQGSLCKRYSIMSGFLSVDGTGITSSNPLCQTSTTP
jgi:hypothetical protein